MPKPSRPSGALASTAAVGLPPARRCRMRMMLVSTTGNTAKSPLPYEPIRKCNDDAHQDGDHQRAQSVVVPARLLPRHARVAERPDDPHPQRNRGYVDQKRGTERPVTGGYDRRQHDPHDIGAAQTDGERSPLSQYAIDHREDDIRRIDGQARDCTLRDELCVMIERKKYVNRPRTDRQRRH